MLGSGDELWETASQALLRWGVKTASGFTVPGDPLVSAGQDVVVLAHLGPLTIREPVTVVSVVDEERRRGFAYATRPGHPVRGEEAFIVHRTGDDVVSLTLRSLTAAPRGAWRLLYPAALIAQPWYRRRYRRALAP